MRSLVTSQADCTWCRLAVVPFTMRSRNPGKDQTVFEVDQSLGSETEPHRVNCEEELRGCQEHPVTLKAVILALC